MSFTGLYVYPHHTRQRISFFIYDGLIQKGQKTNGMPGKRFTEIQRTINLCAHETLQATLNWMGRLSRYPSLAEFVDPLTIALEPYGWTVTYVAADLRYTERLLLRPKS